MRRGKQRYPVNAHAVHGWTPVELAKWEPTLHGHPGRPIKGGEPDAFKGARPVLNGGDEETGWLRPRPCRYPTASLRFPAAGEAQRSAGCGSRQVSISTTGLSLHRYNTVTQQHRCSCVFRVTAITPAMFLPLAAHHTLVCRALPSRAALGSQGRGLNRR